MVLRSWTRWSQAVVALGCMALMGQMVSAFVYKVEDQYFETAKWSFTEMYMYGSKRVSYIALRAVIRTPGGEQVPGPGVRFIRPDWPRPPCPLPCSVSRGRCRGATATPQ
jgi:hypothetical protein